MAKKAMLKAKNLSPELLASFIAIFSLTGRLHIHQHH
jgi:hypothetical protein